MAQQPPEKTSVNDWMNRNKWWFGPIALLLALAFLVAVCNTLS